MIRILVFFLFLSSLAFSKTIEVSCKPFSEPAGAYNKGERSLIKGDLFVKEVVRDTRKHRVYKVEGVLSVRLFEPDNKVVYDTSVFVYGIYEQIIGGWFAPSHEYFEAKSIDDKNIRGIKIDFEKRNMGWVDYLDKPVSYMTNCVGVSWLGLQ